MTGRNNRVPAHARHNAGHVADAGTNLPALTLDAQGLLRLVARHMRGSGTRASAGHNAPHASGVRRAGSASCSAKAASVAVSCAQRSEQ